MRIKFALHPVFFAAYAVLGVFQINVNEIPPEQIIRPLVITLSTTAIIYFILYKLFKNIDRAAMLTTLCIFGTIYFGHVYRFISYYQFFRDLPQHRLVFLILWTALIITFALPKVWKVFSHPALLTSTLNWTSAFILVLPIVTTAAAMRETILQANIVKQRQAQLNTMLSSHTESGPDIYYIIVDGYGRQDTLDAYLNYDNQPFIDFLSEKGFYVANKSQSNYMMTHPSVSSSLNFDYINDLENNLSNSSNRGPYTYLINQNHTRLLLEEQGYQFINIESVALFMRIRDADIYLTPASNHLNEFESLLLTNSIADVLIERLFPNVPLLNYETHRKTIEYQFHTLSEIPEIPGKKFTFVHIWAPHPPFVFDENGNSVDPDRPYFGGDGSGFFGSQQEYVDGYTDELTYLNNLLEQIINDILKKSKTPPIIILQGDHGPGEHTSFVNLKDTCLNERFSIFNAYYFPDGDYSSLSDEISPVNSFRVVLNQYFGAELPLLENRNYYVTWLHPYQYIDVTGQTSKTCEFK